jgi:hypothetical protein
LVNPDYKVIDKFILEESKFVYDKAYGVEDMMRVECFDEEIEVSEIFEENL